MSDLDRYSIENKFPKWAANLRCAEEGGESLSWDKETYLKYRKEGEEAFLNCLDPNKEDNPYQEIKKFEFFQKAYPWFDGFRYICDQYFWQKYKLEEMQKKIREVVESHGLSIEYKDEFKTPYVRTPEGYTIKLI